MMKEKGSKKMKRKEKQKRNNNAEMSRKKILQRPKSLINVRSAYVHTFIW